MVRIQIAACGLMQPVRKPLTLFALLATLVAVVFLGSASAATTATAPKGEGTAVTAMQASLQEAYLRETDAVERLNNELAEARIQRDSWKAILDAYGVQFTTHKSLLSGSSYTKKELTDALGMIRAASARLKDHIESLQQQTASVETQLAFTDELIAVYRKQADEFRSSSEKAAQYRPLVKEIQKLGRVSTSKKTVLNALKNLIDAELITLGALVEEGRHLSSQFETRIKTLQEHAYFSRRPMAQWVPTREKIATEVERLSAALKNRFDAVYIKQQLFQVWTLAGDDAISFGLLGFLLAILLYRGRFYLNECSQKEVCRKAPAFHVPVQMLYRSIYIGGATVFMIAYSGIGGKTTQFYWWSTLVALLILWLFTRWWRTLISEFREVSASKSDREVLRKLSRNVGFIRWYGALVLLILWIDPDTPTLHTLLRLGLEAWLVFWALSVGRLITSMSPEEGLLVVLPPVFRKGLAGLLYIMAFGGVIAEFAGFSDLAVYWYLSIGKSVTVLMWAGLAVLALHRMDKLIGKPDVHNTDEEPGISHSIQWISIRIGAIALAMAVTALVIFSWGGTRTVAPVILAWVQYPLTLGNLSFSLLGTLYTILVLLVTHGVTRVWRHVFHSRFLSRSGMVVGLQDSLTTLSVYVIWSIGILIALHVFGLNTATLALALGALGVGLGFGLQNIFSNFVSGLILLFERPIQVGDDVEIDGIWATVRKINVRATVVQTYDNATLIIPNSDFISKQVTNWSFKDKRVRRNITVGVAYGSDIERVRATLQEIAENTPGVLKFPKPDVIFTDFGDSALVFRLRVHTHIDGIFKTETAIRFAIDRLFRERNIEISFPQRDLHIRSAPGLLQASPVEHPGSASAETLPGGKVDKEETP